MTAAAFLDTNILIYVFSTDQRAARAEELLSQQCATGVQNLNEFANVARRKLGMSWEELRAALTAIRRLCPSIVPLDLEIHSTGLELAERYRLSIFDGLIVAAAVKAGCATLWSKDMQHGLVIEKRLTISNPFLTGLNE
jgi:predicted nucleic acid-binding protein